MLVFIPNIFEILYSSVLTQQTLIKKKKNTMRIENKQNKYEAAEPLYLEVSEMKKKLLEEKHPNRTLAKIFCGMIKSFTFFINQA